MITPKEARLLAAKNNPEVDYKQIEDIFKQIEDAAKSGEERIKTSVGYMSAGTVITMADLLKEHGYDVRVVNYEADINWFYKY